MTSSFLMVIFSNVVNFIKFDLDMVFNIVFAIVVLFYTYRLSGIQLILSKFENRIIYKAPTFTHEFSIDEIKSFKVGQPIASSPNTLNIYSVCDITYGENQKKVSIPMLLFDKEKFDEFKDYVLDMKPELFGSWEIQ